MFYIPQPIIRPPLSPCMCFVTVYRASMPPRGFAAAWSRVPQSLRASYVCPMSPCPLANMPLATFGRAQAISGSAIQRYGLTRVLNPLSVMPAWA